MTYVRVARSLDVARDELDRRYPNRDRRSDGALGDKAHSERESKHNPNSVGIVTARDFDVDGIDAAGLAETGRRLGEAGDPRMGPGSHVIFNRRIASPKSKWRWRRYGGPNPHTGHVHIAVSDAAAGYDSIRPWGIYLPVTNEEDDVTPEQATALIAAVGRVERALSDTKRGVAILRAGDDDPASGDQRPREVGLTEAYDKIIKRLDAIEAKLA